MHLLLVEDNKADAILIQAMADQVPGIIETVHVQRLAEAIKYLHDGCPWDLVLLDLGLPDSQGLETLTQLLGEEQCKAPVVVLTGLDDEENALAAIRHGAQDYLVKGRIDAQLLARTISYARERHRLRAALEQSMARMRLAASVMDATLEGIFVTDADYRIIEINPAFTDITGLTLAEVKDESPVILGAGLYEEERYLEIEQTVRGGGFWQGEVWNRRKDGEVYAAWLNVSAIPDGDGHDRGYVGIFTDITQRKLVEEHLKKMAHYDVLTGLPNRALFLDRLAQALLRARREGGRVAVMFLDLDKFKPINDSLGHDAGDEILREIGERLRRCVRESDTVSRLGGDEFTVILHRIEHDSDAVRIAEKILEGMRRPFYPKNVECQVGVSIGISIYPEHGLDQETLMKKADCAMYLAKEEDGNSYRLYSGR